MGGEEVGGGKSPGRQGENVGKSLSRKQCGVARCDLLLHRNSSGKECLADFGSVCSGLFIQII